MRACLDIGNTKIKCGLYNHDKLFDFSIVENLSDASQYLAKHSVQTLIISDVRGVDSTIEQLKSSYRTILLNSECIMPFEIDYYTPHTLGIDRLAAAAGAISIFPNENILTIDAGTCITIGIIYNKKWIGGSISPGFNMRLRALHEFTGKLPFVQLKNSPLLFGKDTETSIISGAIGGAILELETRITSLCFEFKINRIVTTGGDGAFLVEQLKNRNFASQIYFEPHLVLNGLNTIGKLNES